MKKLKGIITLLFLIPLIPVMSLFGFFKFIFVDFWGYVKQVDRNIDLLRDGIATNGEIVSISQTGGIDGNNPVCRVQVSFIDGDGNRKIADAIRAIKIVDMPNYQRGCFVMIKYNPKKTDEIALDI
ncbi:DUF3592 domain-containing protein [Affinibrenneria salicis]|uniref:DUF3592 domain-containing protein n=1 Tax=Affinibrenneria salicis TaxID=2590031 RepID=A0A5J5G612_9GAMM|nr:DUF3592 domain-containing protein [Affinibrenneria salicis]KAA9002627.1 DUF3592 domain-containing protein [Affinibrenneria salicis]KAA9003085.1 DUF3592 domain-containing protein [Affinibrenneria salicis]